MTFSNQAGKFVEKADLKLRERLRQLFVRLCENPVPAKEYDLKKIVGEEDTYRIRLSSYRVVYAVYWNEGKVRVLKTFPWTLLSFLSIFFFTSLRRAG